MSFRSPVSMPPRLPGGMSPYSTSFSAQPPSDTRASWRTPSFSGCSSVKAVWWDGMNSLYHQGPVLPIAGNRFSHFLRTRVVGAEVEGGRKSISVLLSIDFFQTRLGDSAAGKVLSLRVAEGLVLRSPSSGSRGSLQPCSCDTQALISAMTASGRGAVE